MIKLYVTNFHCLVFFFGKENAINDMPNNNIGSANDYYRIGSNVWIWIWEYFGTQAVYVCNVYVCMVQFETYTHTMDVLKLYISHEQRHKLHVYHLAHQCCYYCLNYFPILFLATVRTPCTRSRLLSFTIQLCLLIFCLLHWCNRIHIIIKYRMYCV